MTEAELGQIGQPSHRIGQLAEEIVVESERGERAGGADRGGGGGGGGGGHEGGQLGELLVDLGRVKVRVRIRVRVRVRV